MRHREVNDEYEVQEMENMNKSDIRIGPEIKIDNVDKIENHSSFICLKCNKKVYIQKKRNWRAACTN